MHCWDPQMKSFIVDLIKMDSELNSDSLVDVMHMCSIYGLVHFSDMASRHTHSFLPEHITPTCDISEHMMWAPPLFFALSHQWN